MMAKSIIRSLLTAAAVTLSTTYGASVAGAGDVLTIGVRDDAPPFSWRDEDGHYRGFSVSLCKVIGESAKESGEFSDYRFVGIDAKNRFDKLNDNKIDILCGATTVTLERMRKFDFTLFTFLSGASYMYPAEVGPIKHEDLKEKRIGVLGDTTTEELVRKKVATMLDPSIKPESLSIVVVDNHFDSIELLRKSEIDVYFADREILLSLRGVAQLEHKTDFRVASVYLSYEPYALAVRRDAADLLFRANQTLVMLFREREIFEIFREWFPGKAMSESLKQFYVLQQVPEGSPVIPR